MQLHILASTYFCLILNKTKICNDGLCGCETNLEVILQGLEVTHINIGCGRPPTPGWTNYDNSRSIWLAKHSILSKFLDMFGLLAVPQKEFIAFAKSAEIRRANATKRIPDADGSVSALYSSHMLEHLDKIDRENFLREALRVLCHGGVIRLAVPNIRFHVNNYIDHNDADRFIDAIHLTRERPQTLMAKCRYLFVGERHHQWMYDGESLCSLLRSVGFEDPQVMEAGKTRIPDPGELDLQERFPESVFVEAVKPRSLAPS